MPQGHLIRLTKSYYLQASSFLLALIIHLLLFSQLDSWFIQLHSSTPDDTIFIDFSEIPQTLKQKPVSPHQEIIPKKEIVPPKTESKPTLPPKKVIPEKKEIPPPIPKKVIPEKKEIPPPIPKKVIPEKKEIPPPIPKEVIPEKKEETLLNRLIPKDEKKKMSIKNLKSAQAAPRLIPEPNIQKSAENAQAASRLIPEPNIQKSAEKTQQPKKEKIFSSSPKQKITKTEAKNEKLPLKQEQTVKKESVKNEKKPLEPEPKIATKKEPFKPKQQVEITKDSFKQQIKEVPQSIPELQKPSKHFSNPENLLETELTTKEIFQKEAEESAKKEILTSNLSDESAFQSQASEAIPVTKNPEKTHQDDLAPLPENYLFSKQQQTNSSSNNSDLSPQDGIKNGILETTGQNFYQLNNYHWEYESYMGYWAEVFDFTLEELSAY